MIVKFEETWPPLHLIREWLENNVSGGYSFHGMISRNVFCPEHMAVEFEHKTDAVSFTEFLNK